MRLAAAEALASLATDEDLVPEVLDPDVHKQVAEAVCNAAIESGVARLERAPSGM
jgi:malic enzyme